MHNRSHSTLHLGEIFRLARILNQPTNLHNLILIAMIFAHRLISSSQPSPGLFTHRRIERIAELQAYLLGDALFLCQLFESRKVSHLMSNKFHGTIGTV
jgi:hypothetical protein